MRTALALCLFVVAAPTVRGQGLNATKVSATLTKHKDGTKTETIKDLFKHEMEETVFDGRGVVIAKKKFLLNDNGDPTQGTIHDGADNLLARVQFAFDELGRVTEELCTNAQGEVFQRVIHPYDANGKPLQTRVYNFPVKAPNMRPAKMDFTQSNAPGSAPLRAGDGPRVETASPGTRGAVPVGTEPPPPNFQVPASGGTGAAPSPATDAGKKGGSKLNPLNWFKKGK